MKFTTTMLTLLALTTAALAIPVPPAVKASKGNPAIRPLLHAGSSRPADASSVSQKVPGAASYLTNSASSKVLTSLPGGRTTKVTGKRLAAKEEAAGGRLAAKEKATGKRLTTKERAVEKKAAGKRLTAKEKAAEKRLTAKEKAAGITVASKKKAAAKNDKFLKAAFAKPEAYTKLFKSKEIIDKIKDSNGQGELAIKQRRKAKNEAAKAKKLFEIAKSAIYDNTDEREAAIDRAAVIAKEASQNYKKAASNAATSRKKRLDLEARVKQSIREDFEKTQAQLVKQNLRLTQLEGDVAGI